MTHYLDKYIYGEKLTDDEARYLTYYPLQMFAYRIAGCKDYKRVQGNLALVQMSHGKGRLFKDISYVLDCTGLTKWQKLWLKIQYLFL